LKHPVEKDTNSALDLMASSPSWRAPHLLLHQHRLIKSWWWLRQQADKYVPEKIWDQAIASPLQLRHTGTFRSLGRRLGWLLRLVD